MTATTTNTIIVCDTCAPAIACGDLTGIHPEVVARVEAAIEIAGLAALLGPTDPGGYWQCDACWYDHIGTGTQFVTD